MEIEYYGGNCLKITTKKATLVVDDNLDELGAKSITKDQDIAVFTLGKSPSATNARLSISEPGEYEVSNISILGIAARAHTDELGKLSATVYKITVDDLRLVIAGHIYPDLNNEQLEAIGTVDVLCVPVGGGGFTLDGVGAVEVVKKIEPKIIIPAYYQDPKLKYPTPVTELADALKNMAIEPADTLDKLKVKPEDFAESSKLIVLKKQ